MRETKVDLKEEDLINSVIIVNRLLINSMKIINKTIRIKDMNSLTVIGEAIKTISKKEILVMIIKLTITKDKNLKDIKGLPMIIEVIMINKEIIKEKKYPEEEITERKTGA